MNKFLSKISEKIATSQKNHFDLSCDNITTQDFFQLKPVYTRQLVPNSDIKIDTSVFSRLSPLTKPMYGSVSIVNRAFFVPYRTIMKWNEFITQAPDENGLFVEVPFTTNDMLIQLFTYSTSNATLVTEAGAPYDFEVPNNNSSNNYHGKYKFTLRGRRIYDILVNLGYRINFTYGVTSDTGSNPVYTLDNTKVNLLPLLAYRKVWDDWLRNCSYNQSNVQAIDWTQVEYNTPFGLDHIFAEEMLSSCYRKDYFTTAWDNPVAPNSVGGMNSITIKDITDPTASIEGTVTSTPTELAGTPTLNTEGMGFTQYLDSALHKLTDYMKRHQIAGSRAMERFAARFGIQLPDAKLNRSVYLGKFVAGVDVADVTNLAADNGTEQVALGDFAGKAIGSGKGTVSYHTDEYGQIIIISTVMPRISYYQGRDRQITQIEPIDFFTPEFDQLGTQPIRRDELICYDNGSAFGQSLSSSNGTKPDGIFGFTSRYAEYKCPTDRITGDFMFNTRNTGLDVYHLGRKITPGSDDLKHTYNFCYSGQSQFSRIFANQDNAYDHFVTIYHFNVDCQQPMTKMFDDYEWDESAGREQKIELNGTQLD